MKYVLFYSLIHLLHATPHINLYQTYSSTNNNLTQYHCIRLAAATDQWNINRQIISYCLTLSLFDYHLEEHNSFPTSSFAELSQAKITTEQLYHWSAPIDLIEDYQFYLDQTSPAIRSTLENTLFYNCTLPRFGPSCQYQFDFYHPNHTSLNEMVMDFYQTFPYDPTEFTCYEHLKCARGPDPLCLDWSEICDGKIDCSNGGIDEEHCWELDVNECGEDEYRCLNGQCIPRSFYLDDPFTADCLDQTDEQREQLYLNDKCIAKEPSIICMDVACTRLPLTSACLPKHTNLLVDTLLSRKDSNVSDECWLTFKCIFNGMLPTDPTCRDVGQNGDVVTTINENCPAMLLIPTVPVLFNQVYFAYTKSDAEPLSWGRYWAPHVCFDTTPNEGYYPERRRIIFNNLTCVVPSRNAPPGMIVPSWIYAYLIPTYRDLQKYLFFWNYSPMICNRPSMYQCLHSPKCISIYRLMNGISDCPHNDDENITKHFTTQAFEKLKRAFFYCQFEQKYITLNLLGDGTCHCEYPTSSSCEDENLLKNYVRTNIIFQTICDGYNELLPMSIDEHNETDETECDRWYCDNIYTHCNGLWDCPKGEDEIGCHQPSSLTCSLDEHLCISNQTSGLVCLPLDKINDGNIDCLGATDERTLCYESESIIQTKNFYCKTDRFTDCIRDFDLCDREKDCIHRDDEQFCLRNRRNPRGFSICQLSSEFNLTDVETFICDYTSTKIKREIVYFTLDQTKMIFEDHSIDNQNIVVPTESRIDPSHMQKQNCHRGLDLRIWFNGKPNSSNTTCLCPPTFYGHRCQYQNQRIALSIQFRVPSDSRHTPFAVLISLIDQDDKRLIHSHEQFTYLSIRDCQVKFSIYLLYSSRPKNPNKQYSIHIDIYEKQPLTHRASILIPVQFSFLPVHRLSYIIDIPTAHQADHSCSTSECDHGRCLRYSRSPNNNTFCQCNRGWTGRFCSISHACQCAGEAICVGVDANNRSVCVCPLYRFGPRCLLRHSSCSTNNDTCQNGGECIPNVEFTPFPGKFTCICRKGYIGQGCETIENEIVLSFEPDIISTPSIFIHFVRVVKKDYPERATTLRTIPFRQESVVVHWSQPFHLVFVEFPIHNYYFVLAQTIYNRSTITRKMIRASDRCRHIRELFDDAVMQLHPLRRIKYYQVPCQRDAPDLMCFYDDVHLCLCQDHHRRRVANCFEFNHNMTFNCLGQSVCQNDGQCFQDSPTCPRTSMCICPACYYGTRCQFTTSVFSLSLDAILGYHIQPSIGLTEQPVIVQISVALTIIFILVGLLNGVLAVITFKNKNTRSVGCGYYLFGASIGTLVITVIFGLKFFILLLAQMEIIVNRSFLSFQCHSVDFILRCSSNMNQWLNAFVAVERTVTIVKGVRFDKKKSKWIAKLGICVLLLIILATGLDDPIHRQLIDEESEDEKRIWCVVSYSSTFQRLNTGMSLFHFITPFLLNLISPLILIVVRSRHKMSLQNDRYYSQVLREEVHRYRHLLIAPVFLVIISLPYLIISFASKCMKFNSMSWLFLLGYLVSFVPSMLTFVLFVIPSEFYMREFRTGVTRYRWNLEQRTNILSLTTSV